MPKTETTMPALFPYLLKVDSAVLVELEDGDGNAIQLCLQSGQADIRDVCQLAAERLRYVADIFERIGSLDDPFQPDNWPKLLRRESVKGDTI